ncbi:MAG TPA: hypothetical protein PLM22_02800 [Candidatus Sabulitectum sp.]|nr:hypothetical protein [Candidatus Sabulitectum sp.]HPF32258.1 hypothetical protein [Candidatus Sabulitectum sp.]HPJ27835.1 hypothetical protein [Candidatus Sabulitectum sp.]HPR21979.1 hypothetical protein [Candidatus Sabulitectum sp.]HRW77035.1 hypothetical protein [Candidatus Sabulitectum sp.]
MKASSLIVFLALFLVAGAASASTLVDLVCHGEVIEIVSLDEENVTMELVVNFFEVDNEASATDYFADSFMDHEGNMERVITLEGLSKEDMDSIAEGSLMIVNYWNASGIMESEDGGWTAFSSTSWTYLGEVPDGTAPSMCPVSML